jgi:hypothetical protein
MSGIACCVFLSRRHSDRTMLAFSVKWQARSEGLFLDTFGSGVMIPFAARPEKTLTEMLHRLPGYWPSSHELGVGRADTMGYFS